MSGHDRFDVFMKMLEIIERDLDSGPRALSDEDSVRVTTVIEKLQGNLVLQTVEGDSTVTGDRIEHISNSIIATRGSIAKGIVSVRETRGSEVADALKELEEAVAGATIEVIGQPEKAQALELLSELTRHAGSPNGSKPVLRSLGEGLWKAVEAVEPVAKVAGKVWPVLEKLWQ